MLVKFSIAALLLLATCTQAGVIVTRDGDRVEGELKKTVDGWDVISEDGKTTQIRSSQVESIELKSTTNSGMEGLRSLRRSVFMTRDPQQAVDRYKRFREQTQDVQIRKEVDNDLALWQQRVDDNMIRVGLRWVTPAEHEQILVDNLAQVDAVRSAMKANNTPEATRLVSAMLARDSDSFSAHYFNGILQYRQGKFIDARISFDAVTHFFPNHGPTLLNRAVIYLKLRQYPFAASLAARALEVEPGVPFLIDQAAELIESLPDDQRKNASVVKLVEIFTQQDRELQEKMLQRQQYRWGSGWVDKATFEQLQTAEKAVKAKLVALSEDYDLTQARLTRISSEMEQNERAMRDMQGRTLVRNADGTLIRLPLPAAYSDLQRDNIKLRAERVEMWARVEALRGSAKRTKADLPVPKFSGVVKMVEEDGVPVILPRGLRGIEVKPAGDPFPATGEVPPKVPEGPGATTGDAPPVGKTAPTTVPQDPGDLNAQGPATKPAPASPPADSPPPIIRIGPADDGG